MNTRAFFNGLRSSVARLLRASWGAAGLVYGFVRLGVLHAAQSPRAQRWKHPAIRAVRVTVIAGTLAFVTVKAGGVCFERVEPGTVGVKQANWGSGIEEVDHAPGLYFSPPGSHTWHHLDARTKVVSFASKVQGGQYPALELRTAQGNTVEMAATVPYRILPGRAHRIVADGKKLGLDLRVKATVERVLQTELAHLDVDEYFDVDKRSRLCEEALAKLNTQLESHHVVADRILINHFAFPTSFEKKMQEDQLASQTVRTNAVLARLDARQLVNAFVSQELARAKQSLKADLDAEFEAQRKVANLALERQKVTNQRLTHELAMEKDQLLAKLARDFKDFEARERDLPVAQRIQENARAAHALEQEGLDLQGELERSFEAERSELGIQRLAAQQRANELAALALDHEEQVLAGELALALAEERTRLEGDALAIRRQALEDVGAIEQTSSTAIAVLVAESDDAHRAAEALRDELRAGVLATPGGRIYLAREAANNLSIPRVTLNANDPRVPSVLDLDALVGLLMGEAD